MDDALQEDLGPHGWVFEDGKYRGLEVGTKVVCTNSFNIGHVGCVEEIHEDGRVTYRFPALSVRLLTYELWESKSKWVFTVVPPETDMWTRMTETQTKQYYRIEKTTEKVACVNGLYVAFLPRGELKRRRAVETRWRTEDDRYKTEDARRLMEDTTGGDGKTTETRMARRKKENIQRVLENGDRKTELKQIAELDERACHRYHRKELLLYFLQDISCLANLILDLEETIQEWSSPLGLGWLFENGEYKGLRSGTRVVCTERFIGHVGYVNSIEHDSTGTIKWHFPTYRNGLIQEVYSANQAIKSWALCVVPDDIDLSKKMSPEEARSYLKK